MDRKLINDFLYAKGVDRLRVKGGGTASIRECPYSQVYAVMMSILSRGKKRKKQLEFQF